MPAAVPVTCERSAIEDIEDLFNAAETAPVERTGYSDVVPKNKKNKPIVKKNVNIISEEVVDEKPNADSIIPGTQKIYVKTWGCSHNNSDSEYMAGQLATYGYKITDLKDEADLWLLNSCTVKSPAEDHFRNEIKSGKSSGKHVVVAGCVPQGQSKADYIQGLSVIGVQQIDRVTEVVEETLKGHTVRFLGTKKIEGKKGGGARLDLPKIRKNPLVEIIAINTGCLNACTYCKTKHARGELGSYPIEEIVARAKQSFEEGVVELWLTSEDTGAYGRDIGVSLPQLLWKLVEVIPEGAMLRLGMTNPPYILEHLEEVAKILNHPRVYSFLHVPVQSASDVVLSDMKREYCQDDFRHVADFLKERVKDITIATDVICGFPTETAEDFDETLKLVADYKFPSLFINQFFPRPGTPAARMPKVPMVEVKRRTKAISELFQSYHPYGHKLGERQRVLVTEMSHDGQYYVAHNKSYDQVLVPKEDEYMGKMLDVDIVETGKHYLKGQVVNDRHPERPATVPPPLKPGQVSGLRSLINQGSHKHMTEQERHPFWVQMAVVVVTLAILLRVAIFVFDDAR